MISEHYAAVQDLLPPNVTAYRWNVPEAPEYPYVVLWGGTGDELAEDLGDNPDAVEFRIRATYAAENGDSLSWIIGKVRGALNRKRPAAVPGWRPEPLRQSSLVDAQTDFDNKVPGTERHPVFAVDEYELLTQRTS